MSLFPKLGLALTRGADYRVTSAFAIKRALGSSPHIGIDYGRPSLTAGKPVYAPVALTGVHVVNARQGMIGGFDKFGFLWRFCHLQSWTTKTSLSVGEQLGVVGSRGTTVSHLHVDVSVGRGRNWTIEVTKIDPAVVREFLFPGAVYQLHLRTSQPTNITQSQGYRFGFANIAGSQVIRNTQEAGYISGYYPVIEFAVGDPLVILKYPQAVDYFSRIIAWTEGFSATERYGMTRAGFDSFVTLAPPAWVQYVADSLRTKRDAASLYRAYYGASLALCLRMSLVMHLATRSRAVAKKAHWFKVAVATYTLADLAYQRGPYHKALPAYERAIVDWLDMGGSLTDCVNAVTRAYPARDPRALITRWEKHRQVFG